MAKRRKSVLNCKKIRFVIIEFYDHFLMGTLSILALARCEIALNVSLRIYNPVIN